MIDRNVLKDVLRNYKRDLDRFEWKNESYKWRAIESFEKNWDIEAPDLSAMLKRAFEKAGNLLTSNRSFPLSMLCMYAEAAPDRLRAALRELFDEKQAYVDRVLRFKRFADEIHAEYRRGEHHFQSDNAISVYLWLRYPDRYCIYKFLEVKAAAEALHSGYRFKKGYSEDNLRNAQLFYGELRDLIREDAELVDMVRAKLTAEEYPDPELVTLAQDVGFYISRYYTDIARNAQVEEEAPKEQAQTGSPVEPTAGTYTRKDFLDEVFMSPADLDLLSRLVKRRKNVILQGAPGTGKTFAAKRLAFALMGERDESRIETVQFHQSYTYEDFIVGYKPDGTGFSLREGVFYRFCRRAEEDAGRDYYFIIDEINRGNLSRIFGELLMLIEREYRGIPMTLAAANEPFAVPENVHIIGMMNTADRSLALIDYALRRRFAFFDMAPGFDSEGFRRRQAELGSRAYDRLIESVKQLNQDIAADPTLGEGFRIGRSYFLCSKEDFDETWPETVVRCDLLPMLREYWIDEPKKLAHWTEQLSEAVHD